MTGQRPDHGATARKLGQALRSLQQQSGSTLRSLETQVRISDSSLSRYFRGETVPAWPVVRDLCHALGADPAEYRALWEATAQPPPDEAVTTADAASPSRSPGVARWHRWRKPPPSRGAIAAAAATAGGLVAVGLLLLLLPPQGVPGTAPAAQDGADRSSDAGVLVHNVEKACQEPRTTECALSLAYNPYRPYVTANSADRVWHHDLLDARCTIANGITVTDENHKHTSIWIQVTRNGKHLWLPGIRVHPDNLNQLTTALPPCPP
ncbi:helix-turn-helix domain-containing protein [Streptomyces sp. NPDC002911]